MPDDRPGPAPSARPAPAGLRHPAFGVFVVGSNASQWDALARDSDVVFSKVTLTGLGWVIPRFEALQTTMSLSYGVGVSSSTILLAAGYAVAWIAGALWLAGWLLERREI